MQRGWSLGLVGGVFGAFGGEGEDVESDDGAYDGESDFHGEEWDEEDRGDTHGGDEHENDPDFGGDSEAFVFAPVADVASEESVGEQPDVESFGGV